MKFTPAYTNIFLLCIFISTHSCEQPASKKETVKDTTTQKMEMMEGEMPLPPTAVVKSKAVELETWFYTFANSTLDTPIVRYQIGMFDVGDAVVLAVKRVSKAAKTEEGGYAYYKVSKELSESKTMMTKIEELQAKVVDIRAKLAKSGESDHPCPVFTDPPCPVKVDLSSPGLELLIVVD